MKRLIRTASPTLPRTGSAPARLATAGLSVALFAGLATAVLGLPAPSASLPLLVRSSLPASGVQNPVTAVLLNFRGYDTLLEVAVLLLAAVAARTTGGPQPAPMPPVPEDDFPAAFFRLAAPLMIVVAGYVLWVGKHAPGGAFQAGAILAAAGVMAVLMNRPNAVTGARRQSLLLVLGPLAFILVGLGTMHGGGGFLQYPPERAGALILLIESAAAPSIAMALVVLFVGCLKEGPVDREAAGPGAEPRRTGRRA